MFQRELAFLDVVAADKPERLPVVLSREEIARVWPQFKGLRRLMFQVMYGAGLRHRECRRLRIKDICLDEGHIVVRTGKGAQDRITVLPARGWESFSGNNEPCGTCSLRKRLPTPSSKRDTNSFAGP